MAEVDTGIYRANTVDPLAFPTKVQALQQGILQNRLLGQQVQGKEALGRIIGGATGADGVTNWGKVSADAADDPMAAILLPEIQKANLERQLQELGLDKATLELTGQRWGRVGDTAGALLAQKEPLTAQQVGAAVRDNLLASGMFNDEASRQQLVGFMGNLPQDDAGIRNYLKNVYLSAGMTAEKVGTLLGAVNTQDIGGQQLTTQTSPLTGERSILATTEKTRTPESKATFVERYNPETKAMERVTSGEAVGDAAPGTVGAPGARTGRYPGAGGRATTAMQAGPALGEAEEATTTAAQSTQAFQKDLTEAGGYAQRIQGLNKASEALAKAQTGPGSAKLQNYSAVINTFFPKAPGADRVNSYAEAQKYLQDYANRRGAELGMGTDAARALVSAANPGVNTPKGAAEAVVNVIKGLERMQASQVAVAQAEGVRPSEYNAWRAKWNRSVDPAAFAPPRLTKAEWQAKSKSMGDKWPAYQKGLKAAVAAGVISPSDYLK